MYYPEYNGFPPVHLNLSLYKDLLKNFPFGSGEDFQAFLNATSQSQTSTMSSAANQSPSTQEPPLSSTFSNSASRPRAFWRNLSFSRKSYKVNPPRRAKATQNERSCSLEMNPILNARPLGSQMISSTANGTVDPPQPTSLVNENAQIGVDDSDLNEIRIVDDAAIIENNP